MDWLRTYHLAVLEKDPQKMPERLAAARLTIQERLQVLASDTNHNHPAERQELKETLRRLAFFESEDRGWAA
jgi:hypothetical protein